jgi:hypothetical protein
MSEENILAEIDWLCVEESPTIDFDTWIGIITTFKISYLDKILKEPTSEVPPHHLRVAKMANEIEKLLQEEVNNGKLECEVDDFGQRNFRTREICARAYDRDIEGLCRKRGAPLSEEARKFLQEINFLYTPLSTDSSGNIIKKNIPSLYSLHIQAVKDLLTEANPGRKKEVLRILKAAIEGNDPLLTRARANPPKGEISRHFITVDFCVWAEINGILTVNEKLGEFPEDSKVGLEIKKWHKENEGDQMQREAMQPNVKATLESKEKKKRDDKFTRADPDGKIQDAIKKLLKKGKPDNVIPFQPEILEAATGAKDGLIDRNENYKDQVGCELSTIQSMVRSMKKKISQ